MTTLDQITHEGNTVRVRLHALTASRFTSLDRTATRHFADWQAHNWPRLKYKSCALTNVEREDDPANPDHYYYTAVYQLKGL